MESEDASQLDYITEALRHVSADKRLGALAAIRRITILTKDHPTLSQSQLDPKPYIDVNKPGKKVIGHMAKDSTDAEQRVLVEWKYYKEDYWEKHGLELLERIAGIAQRLGVFGMSEDLRVLHCSGFYNAPDLYALGLVFEFPRAEPVHNLTTLRDLLTQDRDARRLGKENKPLLGSRFKLAHKLATSLLEFHKLGWLHKCVSSFNIVFFPTSDLSSDLEFIEKPYMVGFVHSRPNEQDAFTEGPPGEDDDYQHPAYVSDKQRFCPEFDYYSLGIVLLELGLWKTIQEMTDSRDWEVPMEEFRQKLLMRRVPQLGKSMGARYRDAVKACLQWNSNPQNQIASVSVFLDFQRLVVDQLASCTA